MAKNTSFEEMQSSFQGALQQCIPANNVDLLHKKYISHSALEQDKKTTLDHVFREYLLKMLEENTNDISLFESYIELSIQACRQRMCNATLPVVLLGDVFDALTLDKCELLFAFVEKGVNVWKEECFFGACKNNLLRMCNDLLRRLSRSQNTVFCGRILLFLAKFFPFSERSGLNVVSEFNLDNVTEYGDDVGKVLDIPQSKVDKMEEDEEADVKADIKLKIDYNLYCKFWALQDFFRNPNQCYSKLQWRVFISHAGDVLSAFSSFKLEDVGIRSTKQEKTDDTDMKDKADQTMQQYFAKYLTNQKLLELQLSDSNFRRYVLLQFLILFQYLCSTVKFRPETDELKPEQSDWVQDTTKQVYTLLEETPPDGKEFANTVRHILQREEHWNTWKNEGCPVFKKPATLEASDTEQLSPPKSRPTKRIGDQIREASAQKKFVMGNPELTKLWNLSSNNIEACRSKDRNFLPSLESYFEEAIQQSNPANMIEEGYKRVNDGNFGWRALRLLARRSPHFFTHSNNPINKLPEYLETMIKRIAKDLPSTATEETSKQPEAVEEELQQSSQDGPDAEEDELLREEDRKDTDNTAGIDGTETEEAVEEDKPEVIALTKDLLREVATLVAAEWTKLAKKLGYKDDEIEYLQSEHSDDVERANHLLSIWNQDDEDASAPGLAYTLSGLGLTAAAQLLQ